MSWTQQAEAPNVFSRPFGPNETFIKAVGDTGQSVGLDHWAVNCTAMITPGGIPHQHLTSLMRDAWVHMRFLHPSLAAYPDSSGANLVYNVPSSEEDLQEWTLQTFTVVSHMDCADDVIANIGPSALAKLYFVPRTNEIVLHSAHWRTDGIGGFLLMGQFIDLIVNLASDRQSSTRTIQDAFQSLAWGQEVKRLTPSVEEAIQAPHPPNELQEQIASELTGSFAHKIGAIGIPYEGDATTRPSGTRSVKLTLDPQTTATIVEAVKARGLTVTAAIHASVASANHQLAVPENKDRHYTSTIRLTLRSYLPEKFFTPSMGSGLYTTGWMMKVDPSSPWQSLAQEYQKEYRKGYPEDYLLAHKDYATRLCEFMKSPPPSNAKPPSDVDISSLGVVDTLVARTYGTAECGLDVMSLDIGINHVTRQGILFVFTFRGQLNLSLAYNEVYHGREQMLRFVDLVKEDLFKHLGMPGSH